MEEHHITMAEFTANAAFFAEEAARGVRVVLYSDDAEFRPLVWMLSHREFRALSPPQVILPGMRTPEEIEAMMNQSLDHLDASLDHLFEDEK